jgi:hypothetical protein
MGLRNTTCSGCVGVWERIRCGERTETLAIHRRQMPELRIQIPDALDAKIEAAMPEYLDRKGFLCLLIDQALDSPVTLGEPSTKGEGSTSKAVTSRGKPNTYKTAYIEIDARIAPELSFCRLDLIDWWALRRAQYGKQAVGTEQAWTTSQNALLAILRVHGAQVVTDTVQAGLANAWRGFRESYAVLPKAAATAQGQAGRPQQPSLTEQARALGII